MIESDRLIVAFGLDPAHLAVPVDLTVYSIDAAMRAAYKLTDRCFVWLHRDAVSADRLIVYLVGRSVSTDLLPIAAEFQNELLDQTLRCRLEQDFKDVRTLIVAQAFSEGNLIDPTADDGDYVDDSLGAGKHR